MFVSTRIAAHAVLLAASVGAGAAMAQKPAPQDANAPKPAASNAAAMAPAAPASASPMTYRSVFDGYRSFRVDELPPWRSVNARLEAPAGLQLTLFAELDGGALPSDTA